MNLTEIIQSEDLKADEKLSKIAKKVAKAREEYGNTDAEITAPTVNTTDGLTSLKFLSAKDKVELAALSIKAIRIEATEIVEQVEGASLSREVERLLATDAVLCNIMTKSENEYI